MKMGISKHRFDHIGVGIILGLLGAGLGFLLFGFVFTLGTSTNLGTFFYDLAYGVTAMYQDKVVTVSILTDVVIFYYFIKKEWYQLSRGILFVVIASVPVALYFY
jgi:hypothetical protein